ncbi:hypothetical protein G7062_10885 [Erysipelothrix sp. HDW6C]|uniref:hypothetical protein n=1 Tax=Erysipelothrix sp. HDW6C TaxID=2714930 RepID=UPI00140B54C4|nr:hypothetical protein [Erysipelothrix sp. HDW6C]QIK70768.1 hypothetical protein G7062_10885 [Erysipelothrix sp. HDW6C]
MEEKKHEMIQAMMSMTYYEEQELQTNVQSYTKFPLGQVAALGSSFDSVVSVIGQVTGSSSGGSGLYYVQTDHQLLKFKNKSGFMGDAKGFPGKAQLHPLTVNPTSFFMATALAGIDRKLDTITEIQQELIQFVQAKERANLRGNLKTLMDVLNNYKYNWNNEVYKTNKHVLIQDIKREAEQSIILRTELINKKVDKTSFFTNDSAVKSLLNTVVDSLKEYQMSLYTFSFAYFLEVMLLENYEGSYLQSVVNTIDSYAYQYRQLYTKCYSRFDKDTKSSIETQVVDGIASFSKFVGKSISKIPVAKKIQIDEVLIDAGDKLTNFSAGKFEEALKSLVQINNSGVKVFVDNINMVSRIFNGEATLAFDSENLYVK